MTPEVTEREQAAANIVLPEHEERITNAKARAASPRVLDRLHREYDDARLDEYDEQNADDDDDDGLDGLRKADLEDLAHDNDVNLDGAANNAERVDRLRSAGVRAD